MKHRVHNIKRQHRIIEGMLPILEQIRQIDGINGIIPARIYKASSQTNEKISIQRETSTGIKLFLHSKREIQEVFILCDKTKMPQIINEIREKRKDKGKLFKYK